MPASNKWGNFGRLSGLLNGGGRLSSPTIGRAKFPSHRPLKWPKRRLTTAWSQQEVCTFCHGIAVIGGAAVPDLRKMSEQTHRMFKEIVLEGVLADRGMSSFADRLSEKDVEDIYTFIVAQLQDYQAQEEAKKKALRKPACCSSTEAMSNRKRAALWAALFFGEGGGGR